MQMQILPSDQINLSKWDHCIAQNTNGLIYAQSSYLNAMTHHWHGLIIGDYKAITPLPWKKKYGIRYLYTPAFTQQLGLIGSCQMKQNNIIQSIQSFAAFGDYFMNYQNDFICTQQQVKHRNNFLLDLSDNYEKIQANYKANLIRNLKKTNASSLEYCRTAHAQESIQLHKQTKANKLTHLTTDDYHRFEQLVKVMTEKNNCITRQVKNESGQILSATVLLKDNRRMYNIINATTEAGKKINANHFLMDQIIREFAGQHLLLDFEGSNISGVQNFYEMFGSFNQPYFHWHYNKLIWPFNLFKS